MQSWQTFLYLLPYFTSLGITLGVGVYAWRRRVVLGARPLAIRALSGTLRMLGFILLLISPTLEGKLFWDVLHVIGGVVTPIAGLFFALEFTEHKISRSTQQRVLIMLFPLIFILFNITDFLHGLVRVDPKLFPSEYLPGLVYDYSPLLILNILYGYGILLASIIILIRKYIKSQPIFRSQIATVVIGILIPTVGFTLVITEVIIYRQSLAIFIPLGNLVIALGLFRYRLLDIAPVAYSTVFANISDAVIVLDSQRRLVDYNPAAQKLLPQLSADLIGLTTREVFSDISDIVGRFHNVEETHTELEIEGEDGVLFQDVRISPLRDRRGRLLGRVILVRDITEQKLAGDALRASEEKYRQLVETTPDWVWSIDIDGNHVFSNEAIKRVLGYEVDEIIGKPAFPFMHPDDQEDMENMVNQSRERKEGWKNVKIRWVHKDGAVRHYESTAQPLLDLEGNLMGFSGIDRDITDRIQAEKDAVRYAAELEAANKELEAFSYSVSHDLRAPLRAITGFSELLANKYKDKLEKDGQDNLQRVLDASQQMGLLIEDLLRLSRVTSSDMIRQNVNLSELADKIAEDLQRSQPDRKVEFNIDPDMNADCDQGLIRVVLENLIGNAWKFTGKKKKTEIAFGCEERDGQKIFFVRDNGVGFDMSYADKMFAPFQRLHPSSEFEGTGIGLATVQRIIRRHGGRVWVEAKVGVGATFYFTLQ